MSFFAKKIAVVSLFVLGLSGVSFAQEKGLDIRMSDHVSFTPFYIYGQGDWDYSAGLEINRWYKPIESGYHIFDYGYGARLYYYDYAEYETGKWIDKQAVYLSPMGSMYYMCTFFFHVGASVSPEVGYGSDGLDYGASARAWFHAFGAEFRWTENKGSEMGFYFYLPVYGMKL